MFERGIPMSGSKEMRHYRMRETIRLFREGKSREEIMEILGIAKSTVNVYLHDSGYSPKTKRMDQVTAAGRLAGHGLTPREIARELGIKLAIVEGYIHEYRRTGNGRCDECGAKWKLEKWKGRKLCLKCFLGYDEADDKPTIEYAMAWGSVKQGGSFQ
jgi:DNA-binding CsgD family transcriptional regulator